MATEADIRAALAKGNRAGLWEAVGYILDGGFDDLLGSYSVTAGAGLTGGGALNTSPTIDIVAADSTITVNADSIQANLTELANQLDQNIEEVLIVGDDANGQQIFSLGRLWISHPTSPLLDMVEEDAPADEGSYRWRQASGLFLFSTYSDAGTFGANIVQVDRTGTTPDLWTFGCDVDMNGNDILMGAGQVTEVGGIDWTGTISTAGSENTANAHSVYSRNVGDTADVRIWDFDSSDNLNISDSNSDTIRMRSGGQIQLRPNGSGSNEYAFTSATADWAANSLTNVGFIDWDGTVPSDGETRMPAQSDGYFRDADDTANLRHFDLGTDETDVITHGANQDVPIRAESSITRDEQASHVGTEWEGIPGGTGVATGLALLQDADGTWQACASGYSYEVEIWFEAQDSPDSTTVTHGKYVAWISFVAGDEAHVKDQGWTAPSNSVLQSNLFPTATVVASNIAQIIPRRASGEGNDWDILARVKHRRAAVTTGSQE